MKSFIFSLLFAANAFAAFQVPSKPLPITDLAGALSTSETMAIANSLVELKKETGATASVLVVETLDGTPIEEATMKVAKAWKLGSAESDDGLVIMFALADRRSRIEVGQGLEGILTDVDCKRILASLRGDLKAARYGTAVKSAVDQIKTKITANKAEIMKGPKKEEESNGLAYLLIGLLGLGSIGLIVRSRRKEAREQAERERKYKESLYTASNGREYANVNRNTYARTTPRRDDDSSLATAVAIASTSRSYDDDSYRSSSSSSSSSYDSGSSWGGGGGDFSGGGSSDSW